MVYTIIFKDINKRKFVDDILSTYIDSDSLGIVQYINTIPNMIRIETYNNFDIHTISDEFISAIDCIDDIEERELGYIRDTIYDVSHPAQFTYWEHDDRSQSYISASTEHLNIYTTTDQQSDLYIYGALSSDITKLPQNWGIARCTLPNEKFYTSSVEVAPYIQYTTPSIPVSYDSIQWEFGFDESSGTSHSPGEYSVIADEDFIVTLGCTDASADNYDSQANTDDGSCVYTVTPDESIEEIATHVIQLQEGWNTISTYIDVTDISDGKLSGIFTDSLRDESGNPIAADDIVDYLHIVKNNDAAVWWPEFYFDGIGEWNANEGYQVRTRQACQLQITGPVIRSMTISINEGWNLIAYPFIGNTLPQTVFAGQHNKVHILKDNDAAVWWPEFEFNGIGEMLPGQGYLLRAHEAFTIPVQNNVGITSPPTIDLNQLQVIYIGSQHGPAGAGYVSSTFSSYINNTSRTMPYIFANYLYEPDGSLYSGEIADIIVEVGDIDSGASYLTDLIGDGTNIPFDGIGNYDGTRSYKIVWTSPSARSAGYHLRIPGNTMVDNTYVITSGVNSIPVPVNSELDPLLIFDGQESKITIIKDNHTGDVCLPVLSWNGIGNLLPGRSYYLRASEPFEVIIPG